MVPDNRRPYRQFLRRVHRRVVAVYVGESVGVGVLAASVFAIGLALLLLRLDRPAAPAIVAAIAAGALGGGAFGLARRPRLFKSAILADQQLRLSDLLSTALTVGRGVNAEPWSAVVLCAADARCKALSPSAVVVRRMGGRAWGGVSVVAMLALTLAALSPGSAGARAGWVGSASGDRRPTIAADLPPLPRPAGPPTARVADSVNRRRTWSDPDDRSRSFPSANRGAETRDSDGPLDQPHLADSGAGDGSGSGAATPANRLPQGDAAPQAPSRRTATDESPASHERNGEAAGGTGVSTGDNERSGRATAGTGGNRHSDRPAPPWRSPGWRADVDTARQSLEAGRVPEAYRDVVRDYFERH